MPSDGTLNPFADDSYVEKYNAYQGRYRTSLRESDKITIELIQRISETAPQGKRPLRLLDVGCSTGNLLLHMRRLLTGVELSGGDVASASLDEARRQTELGGVSLEAMDIRDIHAATPFDIVVVNAVVYMFGDEDFKQAFRSIGKALRPGGTVVVFDLFHPFDQDLTIHERSRLYPAGMELHLRPMSFVRETLQSSGFSGPVFRPFTLPIDLPRRQDAGDITTYTVKNEAGDRMAFRGTLFQPWCHMTAQRAG